jgi:Lon protease-like protein
MFPLSTVLFPGALLPLHVFEARYRTMLAECLRVEPHEFGVVLIARGPEVGGGDERTDVGTVARIEALSRTDDGRYALVARGTKRFRVAQWLPDDPYPEAVVEELADEPEGQRAEAAAAVRRIEALLSELGSPVPDPPATPDTPLWELCSRVPVNTLDRQRLLEARDTTARVTLLVELAGALAEDLTMLLAGG